MAYKPYIPFLPVLPGMMKHWMCVLCASMFLLTGLAGVAGADTVTLTYFFEGIDFDTGQIYHDSTILIVVQGRVKDVDTLLKPPNFASEFPTVVDAYFEFTPYSEFILQYGTSLVFLPDQDAQDPSRIVQQAFLDNIPLNQSAIPPPENFSDILEPILLDPTDTLVLLTAAGDYLKIGNVVQDGFQVQVQIVKPAIPEPATLLLLGLGLAGVAGLRMKRSKAGKSRKHTSRQNSRRLLLLVGFMTGVLLSLTQPLAAQSFECSSVSEIPAAECEALVALYTSTDGDHWGNNEGWLESATPCSWYGVTCSGGHVTRLTLNQNQLQGVLPTELGNLPELTHVSLNHNQLSGSLPAGLSDLSKLDTLDLSRNLLSGPLPPVPVQLAKLRTLKLGYNQFTGHLPAELQHLTGLQVLSLNNNQLTGSISGIFDNLTNLTSLNLARNQFSGALPPELGNLTKLTELQISANLFSGVIPVEFGNLTNLGTLNLGGNQFSGSIPTELGSLVKLDYLNLGYNQLSGGVPDELGNLPQLSSIYLSHNLLFGSLPRTLTNLSKLRRFYFEQTKLCEPGDAEFQNWLQGIQYLGRTNVRCASSVCEQVTEIPTTECEILSILFTDTEGNQWENQTDWLNTDTPCSWYGVSCEVGHVTALNLAQNGLTGSLPAELGYLSQLQTLALNNNDLSGMVPGALTHLSALETFNFQETDLCEPEDDDFHNWLNDVSIVTSSGQTCGAGVCASVTQIPQSECNALVDFYTQTDGTNWKEQSGWLHTNTPCDWFGVTCSSGHVIRLHLPDNQLNGELPASLGDLFELQNFYLPNNHLQGMLPVELGSLSNLQTLTLSTNYHLSGNIPSELGQLSKLTSLALQGNQFSGAIPPELGNLTNLQTLTLYSNELSGSLPAELGKLNQLVNLRLGDNQLSGTIPPEYWNLTNLQSLWLHGNQLSGNLPAELGNLSKLANDLYLNSNQFSGMIPPQVGNLTELQGLFLADNHLSGNLPAELGNLSKLTVLHLYRNQLSGTIPPELGNLTNLQQLTLWNNQLSGTIPSELGNLTNLQTCWLYNNQLSGNIPAELGQLSHVQSLQLHANQLSGNVPVELSNLTQLFHLALSYNQLSGEIPPEFGNLTNLQRLRLENNQLSGRIPPELSHLTKLQNFSVAGNQLSGSFPTSLTNIPSLEGLYFNATNLCEPQDAEFQTWLAAIPDVRGTGVACTNYFVTDDWNGTWYDAEQGSSKLCWAAAASNALARTGWHDRTRDLPPALSDELEQDVFRVFQQKWTDSERNNGGLMNFGWQWWLTGETEPPANDEVYTWAQPLTPPTDQGGYWPAASTEQFSDYFQTASGVNVMTSIETYLKLGYGVTITAYPDPQGLGHAFTVWGLESDASGWVSSLWLTDSDDGERRLFRFPVVFDRDTELWLLDDGSGTYDNWYIGATLALVVKDQPPRLQIAASTVPDEKGTVSIAPAGIVYVEQGQSQTFTIKADPVSGYALEELRVNNAAAICTPNGQPDECTYTFPNVTQNHTIQAIFQSSGIYTIQADADEGGDIVPAGDVLVEAGGERTFSITPKPGYRIKELLIDGKPVAPVPTHTFSEVNANHTISARFVENTLKLAIMKKQCFDADENEIACGTVIDGKPVDATVWVGDQVAPPGTDIIVVPFSTARALILKAKPNEGSRFVRWEANGKIVEGLIDVQHDLLLRPIIRHSCGG